MNTTNKIIADEQREIHMKDIGTFRIALGETTGVLMGFSEYYYNYHQQFGTTTECENILGHAGLMPPKERN